MQGYGNGDHGNRRENGDQFPELSELIQHYAEGYEKRQAMALKVISGAYLPDLGGSGLRDAKQMVEGILRRHDHFVDHGQSGGLHPQSVYAILTVAKCSVTEEDRKWGASHLFRIMEALGKKARSGERYPKYAADAALVSASLTQLSQMSQASRSHIGSLN